MDKMATKRRQLVGALKNADKGVQYGNIRGHSKKWTAVVEDF